MTYGDKHALIFEPTAAATEEGDEKGDGSQDEADGVEACYSMLW